MTQVADKNKAVTAEALIGHAVQDPEGAALGKIEDLVFDINRGRIAYAVLSFGGFLGFGDKLFAVPWHALRIEDKGRSITMDTSREKLEKAPGFRRDDWPDMTDTNWGMRIHTYYGQAPYWESY